MLLTLEHELGYGRDEIGLVGGGLRQHHNKPVMIYVVNSARYRVSPIVARQLTGGQPVMLIADECYHYGSSENRKIFSFLDAVDGEARANYYALGLSATPKTFHFDRVIAPALGPLFYAYDVGEVIADGVVNDVVIFNIGLTMDSEQAAAYEGLSRKISTAFKEGATATSIKTAAEGLFGTLKGKAQAGTEIKLNDKGYAVETVTVTALKTDLIDLQSGNTVTAPYEVKVTYSSQSFTVNGNITFTNIPE